MQTDNFTYSFLIWMPFLSFSCLIALVRTSSTMLNRSGESRHPCLDPNLSPLSMLAVGLSWYNLYDIEIYSFYTQFVENFYRERILLNTFEYATFEMINFFLLLLGWCVTFADLHILIHLCIQGWIPHDDNIWSFSWAEFSLLVICWQFLHLHSSGILAYSFLFL